MRLPHIIALALCVVSTTHANPLPLPARQTNAPTGSEIAAAIRSLEPREREERIFQEVAAGNVPNFLRTLKPVSLTNEIKGFTHVLTVYVTPDYLAVGGDTNFLRLPLTPVTAQRIADLAYCSLPTTKLVDAIWNAADLKLTPEPMPPGPAMTTVTAFEQHQMLIEKQFGFLAVMREKDFARQHAKDVPNDAPDLPLPFGRGEGRGAGQTTGNLPNPHSNSLTSAVGYAGKSAPPRSPPPHSLSPSEGEREDALPAALASRAYGLLVAGHKKDIVIAAVLATKSNSVAIYGWHKPDGRPIQPLYAGHASTWADYSHGIRLIANDAELDGKPVRLPALLTDTNLAAMISGEGPLRATRYPTNWPTRVFKPGDPLKLDFKSTGQFGEAQAEFRFDPEVRVVVNKAEVSKATNTMLVIYTLPNGNTIEHTAGHRTTANEDWHFNIQHIAAQTRFVREWLTNQNVVVAYVEAGGLTWPNWRKRHGDDAIPKMVRSLQSLITNSPCLTVLSGHSGGGSFIFGYLNSVTNIPANVERVAFLDSNYGYTAAHKEKLLRWLRESEQHRLLVFAYNDAAGLLNGKPFVSAEGGTWGRSALMLEQLGTELPFSASTNGSLHTHLAANGRVEFLLRENPERKIWHTVQVERNGFIHALLSGTPHAGKDYEYLGERAYEKFITTP